jgi:phage protein D
LPISDQSRAPRLLVLADGAAVIGAMSAYVTSTSHFGADSFEVSVALSADPAMGAAFWADATNVVLEVQVSLGFEFVSLVTGYVDQVTIDPLHEVAQLAGRDLASQLIEAPTTETFANRTSSQVAALVAGRHGLAANVQQTTTPVGRYWQLEHDRMTLDQFSRATTEWDLLVGLAEREGFDLWVSGPTLNFVPTPTTVAPESVLRPVATLNGPPNVTSLRMERALTLARALTVTVKSWHSKMAQTFVQSATSAPSNSAGAATGQYNFVLPNLTPGVALQIAQQKLTELSSMNA